MFYLLLQNTTLYPVKSKHFIDSVLLDLSDTPHPDRKRSPVKTKLNVMKKFMKTSTNLKGFNMKMLFLIDNNSPTNVRCQQELPTNAGSQGRWNVQSQSITIIYYHIINI